MHVYQLIKKDILLAGNYLLYSLIILIALPIFLLNQGSLHLSNVFILTLSISFSCYFFFNNIFMAEDKYKGNLYLMVIPYKRWIIVIVKYILAVSMVICGILFNYLIRMIMHMDENQNESAMNFPTVAITFFIISVILSAFFPLYFRYSYTKIRVALLIVMILVPTWGLVLIGYLFGKNFISITPTLSIGMSLLLILIGIIVMLVSVRLSVHFLKKRY